MLCVSSRHVCGTCLLPTSLFNVVCLRRFRIQAAVLHSAGGPGEEKRMSSLRRGRHSRGTRDWEFVASVTVLAESDRSKAGHGRSLRWTSSSWKPLHSTDPSSLMYLEVPSRAIVRARPPSFSTCSVISICRLQVRHVTRMVVCMAISLIAARIWREIHVSMAGSVGAGLDASFVLP